jgi:hypothetical protein
MKGGKHFTQINANVTTESFSTFPSCRLEKEGQSRFFHNVLCHPTSLRFPPAEDYTLRVLRLYYIAIDEQNIEYDEDMIEFYTTIMERQPPPLTEGISTPPPCHRTFLFDDGASATCMVHRGFGGATGTGARLWEAGIFMCEYIAANPHIFQACPRDTHEPAQSLTQPPRRASASSSSEQAAAWRASSSPGSRRRQQRWC